MVARNDFKSIGLLTKASNPASVTRLRSLAVTDAVKAITGTAAVGAGKCIYFLFESAPDAATTQMSVDITYDFD